MEYIEDQKDYVPSKMLITWRLTFSREKGCAVESMSMRLRESQTNIFAALAICYK